MTLMASSCSPSHTTSRRRPWAIWRCRSAVSVAWSSTRLSMKTSSRPWLAGACAGTVAVCAALVAWPSPVLAPVASAPASTAGWSAAYRMRGSKSSSRGRQRSRAWGRWGMTGRCSAFSISRFRWPVLRVRRGSAGRRAGWRRGCSSPGAGGRCCWRGPAPGRSVPPWRRARRCRAARGGW